MNENKLNILHLQNYLNITCGVSKTIYLIVKNTPSQFQHYIACLGGDGLSRFKSINIQPAVLKDHKKSLLGFILHYLKLYSFCKKNKINIIHSHHRYFDLLAFILSPFLKVKTVTSVQSKVFGRKLSSYKSDILIACSKTIKNHLLNHYRINEDRIKIIYNMIDPNEKNIIIPKDELLNQLKISTNCFIIGFIGRFCIKEKGIDILLEAFRDLSKAYQNIYLLMIGDGEDKLFVNDFFQKQNIHGKIIPPQIQIFNYYNLLDVLILPSRIEPFGIVVLEAGFMKKALIGSRVDGIAEIIEEKFDGLLFNSGDVENLKREIIKLYDDREKGKQLGENLYKKVISNYSSEQIIPKYEQLYNNLFNAAK